MKGSERRKQVGGFVKTKGQAVMMFSVHVDGMMGMMGMMRKIRSRPGILLSELEGSCAGLSSYVQTGGYRAIWYIVS